MSKLNGSCSNDSLSKVAEFALDYAKSAGMEQADVSLHQGTGVSISARQQALETIEKHNDSQVVVTVYNDHKTGSASSADMTEAGIRSTVDAAVSIAKYTGSDDCLGLADKELMATELKDLDLDHPWDIEVKGLLDIALNCEQAALDFDSRISNSEGASIDTYSGTAVYANSHGFISKKHASQHSVSCSVIGSEQSSVDNEGMQRDYYYDSNRNPTKLIDDVEIGREAAKRTVSRLGARQINSMETPVIFDSRIAKSLIGHLINGISGGAIYKKASFMLDKVGVNILPDFVTIAENPHLLGGVASSTHDSEGVATADYRPIVQNGELQSYVLGSYTARKLGMQSTANSGGVRNISVSNSGQDHEQLLAEMGTGLRLETILNIEAIHIVVQYS